MTKTTVRKTVRVRPQKVKLEEDVKRKPEIHVLVRGAIPPDLIERLAEIQAAAIRCKAKPMQPPLAASKGQGDVVRNDHSQ